MQISIYYGSWQMQCCGDPFKIGDMVQWACVKSRHDNLAQADYEYEAHGDTDILISGKVIQIDALFFDYQQKENGFYPISYKSESIQVVQGYETESGYLIILDNAQIENA